MYDEIVKTEIWKVKDFPKLPTREVEKFEYCQTLKRKDDRRDAWRSALTG